MWPSCLPTADCPGLIFGAFVHTADSHTVPQTTDVLVPGSGGLHCSLSVWGTLPWPERIAPAINKMMMFALPTTHTELQTLHNPGLLRAAVSPLCPAPLGGCLVPGAPLLS